MNFRKLMSQAQRDRMDAEKAEIRRLYGLTDRWLAEALLTMARRCRNNNPKLLQDPHVRVYEPQLLWQIIPELARRLGARNFQPNEATDSDVRTLSDAELRHRVGVALENVSSFTLCGGRAHDEGPLVDPGRLFANEPVNGNPIAFAIDRIASPDTHLPDRRDPISARINEPATHRGFPGTFSWSPEFEDASTAA